MTAPIRSMPDRYELYRIITDMDALHEAWRDRVEDLNVSRVELDQAGGLLPGYASKMLSDPPAKYAGTQSLPKMLRATRTVLAILVDTTAPDVSLKPRKIVGAAAPYVRKRAALSMPEKTEETPINIEELVKTAVSERIKDMRKSDSSAKRKVRRHKQRARQRRATHAARMRWAKQKSA